MNTKLLVGATVGYIAVVNAGAAALFYYDKQQALNNRWRVRRMRDPVHNFRLSI